MPFVTGQEAQNSSGSATATTIAATLNSVTAGNLLWIAVGCFNQSTSISIDDVGNTWNAGPTLSNATDTWQMRLFYAMNVTGGNRTVTATFGASVGYRCIYVQERSGLATSSALEGAGTSLRQTSGTSRNAGSYSNTANGELVAFGFDYNWLAAPTAGAGMTGRSSVWTFNGESSVNSGLAVDASYTGAGSRSALWTMNTGAISYCLQMFLLAASGGGGSGLAVPRNISAIQAINRAAFH